MESALGPQMLQVPQVQSAINDRGAADFRTVLASDLGSIVSERIAAARGTQSAWRSTPIAERLKVVRRFRHALSAAGGRIASELVLPIEREPGVTLAAEIIPLADACRFLERNAVRLLRPQGAKRSDRPVWLSGVDVAIHREPYGVVLVLGTWNFPLFLPGVQIIQALVAGNAVVYKPGTGATEAATVLQRLLLNAGLPPGLMQLLPERPEYGAEAIEAGVDFILLTGSAETGRRVLSSAAERLTPCAMELSGCDSVFIGPNADIDRAARCVVYGLRLNQGATCIAPRRVFVNRQVASEFESRLVHVLDETALPLNPAREAAETAERLVREAMMSGARLIFGRLTHHDQSGPPPVWPVVLTDVPPKTKLLQIDIFAPVVSLITVSDSEEALVRNQECPLALGAAVFDNHSDASHLARQIDAGCITINDLIVPTADPRVSFGGRHDSGYGVTRGSEGLLQLTRIKAVADRRGRWLPHLTAVNQELLSAWLQVAHGGQWSNRILALGRFCRALVGKPARSAYRQDEGRRDV